MLMTRVDGEKGGVRYVGWVLAVVQPEDAGARVEEDGVAGLEEVREPWPEPCSRDRVLGTRVGDCVARELWYRDFGQFHR